MELNEIVKALKTQQAVSVEDGIQVINKHNPDFIHVEIDPIVIQDQMKESKTGTDETIDQATAIMPDFSDSEVARQFALIMRQTMGSSNVDISEGIETKVQKINGPHGEIPIRIYQSDAINKAKPAIIFFHGGGFVGGTSQVTENFCKVMAEQLEGIVLNVEYRLAPEFQAPVASDECYAVVKWAHECASELGINPNQIAVAGDSAGGNLAAVCSYLDRQQENNLIAFQALLYPAIYLDEETLAAKQWPIEKFGANPALSAKLAPGFVGMAASHEMIRTVYAGELDVHSPLLSPGHASKAELEKMPPTLIVVASYDYLRPFALDYGRKLETAGVKVKTICYEGMFHAFIDKIGLYPQAEDCANEIVKTFKESMERNE